MHYIRQNCQQPSIKCMHFGTPNDLTKQAKEHHGDGKRQHRSSVAVSDRDYSCVLRAYQVHTNAPCQLCTGRNKADKYNQSTEQGPLKKIPA